jgi:beta-galactosidase
MPVLHSHQRVSRGMRPVMHTSHTRLLSLTALALLLLLPACGEDQVAVPPPKTFPPSFLWGTATAGFQVEMGCPTLAAAECTDTHSDWYDFVMSPVTVKDPSTYLAGDPVSTGPGFWELYPHDLDGARNELHNNALRLSVEWSRIFPTATDDANDFDALHALADPRAVAGYHAILASIRAHGMTPLVTLNHYTLPSWLHDAVGCHQDFVHCTLKGWIDSDRAVREIAKFAGFCAQEFGGQVDLWATLNEPLAPILAGYVFPSEFRSQPPAVFLRATEAKAGIVAEINAHARMYDAVKAADHVDADGDGRAAQVGLVYPLAPFRPHDPANPLDVQGAKNISYLWNEVFLNATVHGDLDANLDGTTVHRDDLAGRMDFIGVNYYQRYIADGAPSSLLPGLSPLLTISPSTLSNAEDAPRGMYEMVMLATHNYGLPIYITENGTEQESGDPIGYLVRHLTWLGRARRDGADVRGYFVWTLMDNYEWNHGMGRIRLGMYAVDPSDPQKTRRRRPSADVYARIVQAGEIPADLAAAYPEPE